MAWETRHHSRQKYYYRSRRMPDGRVRKEYVGTGSEAETAAAIDAEKRAEREREVAIHQALLEELEQAADAVADLAQGCDVMVIASLLAAGFQCHKGAWRRTKQEVKE